MLIFIYIPTANRTRLITALPINFIGIRHNCIRRTAVGYKLTSSCFIVALILIRKNTHKVGQVYELIIHLFTKVHFLQLLMYLVLFA